MQGEFNTPFSSTTVREGKENKSGKENEMRQTGTTVGRMQRAGKLGAVGDATAVAQGFTSLRPLPTSRLYSYQN